MILKAEVSIDIDPHRKVWLELSARPGEDDDVEAVIHALAAAAVEQAEAMVANREARQPDPEGERQTRELRTFGDDDETEQ